MARLDPIDFIIVLYFFVLINKSHENVFFLFSIVIEKFFNTDRHLFEKKKKKRILI